MTLTEQLAEARERIRELEAALRPSRTVTWPGLDPTPSQSAILESLLQATGPISLHSLRMRIDLAIGVTHEIDEDSVEIAVHRLKKRLAPRGITISRLRGQGFYLDQDNKARLVAFRVP